MSPVPAPASASATSGAEPSAARLSDLSDDKLLARLLDGSLSVHTLEVSLGDCTRAVALRRRLVAAKLASTGHPGRALRELPFSAFNEEMFYKSVLGTNCEAVIGCVWLAATERKLQVGVEGVFFPPFFFCPVPVPCAADFGCGCPYLLPPSHLPPPHSPMHAPYPRPHGILRHLVWLCKDTLDGLVSDWDACVLLMFAHICTRCHSPPPVWLCLPQVPPPARGCRRPPGGGWSVIPRALGNHRGRPGCLDQPGCAGHHGGGMLA